MTTGFAPAPRADDGAAFLAELDAELEIALTTLALTACLASCFRYEQPWESEEDFFTVQGCATGTDGAVWQPTTTVVLQTRAGEGDT